MAKELQSSVAMGTTASNMKVKLRDSCYYVADIKKQRNRAIKTDGPGAIGSGARDRVK